MQGLSFYAVAGLTVIFVMLWLYWLGKREGRLKAETKEVRRRAQIAEQIHKAERKANDKVNKLDDDAVARELRNSWSRD